MRDILGELTSDFSQHGILFFVIQSRYKKIEARSLQSLTDCQRNVTSLLGTVHNQRYRAQNAALAFSSFFGLVLFCP